MPEILNNVLDSDKITKPFLPGSNINRIVIVALVLSIVIGAATGFVLSSKSSKSSTSSAIPNQQPKTASQDNTTFRDFAEGTIKAKPEPKDPSQYTEGTHLLERADNKTPVTLTSSVVDLSKYEGKKVKVYGETQKALQSGWLLDVGKVEEIK